ncbi:MAG: arginine repressor [Acidobacteria bacterium]|nr:arginine repressor [Acidobacteriota bacterium]
MISKEARRNFILETITETEVANQAELVERLTAAGFSVTQASVSRDLQELGVAKRDGRYTIDGRAARNFGPISLVTSGDSLLILRCLPGIASAIAVEIDKMDLNEIAGTLAGDDTIFIAARTSSDRSGIVTRIKSLYGGIEEL